MACHRRNTEKHNVRNTFFKAPDRYDPAREDSVAETNIFMPWRAGSCRADVLCLLHVLLQRDGIALAYDSFKTIGKRPRRLRVDLMQTQLFENRFNQFTQSLTGG